MERKYIEKKYHKDLDIEDERFYDLQFIDCVFENCKFRNITIDRCLFLECEFINCDIVTLKSESSDVKELLIKESNLIGISWGLLISDQFSYASPIKKINDSFIKYNYFTNINLNKADFSKNTFDDCLFDQCNLKESKFKGSLMKQTQITNSNLERADFRKAEDYYIDLNSNKLTKAKCSYPEVVRLLDSIDIDIE